MTLAPDDPRHGTANAYRNLGCRCIECQAGNVEHERAKTARIRARFARSPSDACHGTRYTYNALGCRCVACRDAERRYRRARRLRLDLPVQETARALRGPDREQDARAWNGRVASEYGCTATFENDDGERLTLHRAGQPEAVLDALCDEAKAIDGTLRVVSYSSPTTILTDVTGPPTEYGRHREATILGQIGRLERLHPRLRGRSSRSEQKYREIDALAR